MIELNLIGNIGKDAEVKTLDNATLISFSVAHTEKFKNKQGQQSESTTWVDCTIWKDKDQSTKISEYLLKGVKVYLSGVPSVRAWKNQNGDPMSTLQLNVRRIELLSSVKAATESVQEQEPNDLPF